MNIVILSLNDIRLVGAQESNDLDAIRAFISKDITTDVKLVLIGETANDVYPLVKVKYPGFEKQAFYGYKVSSRFTIPEGVYSVAILGQGMTRDTAPSFYLAESNRLEDEHTPIYIEDRKIGAIAQTVVAGDVNSQQFTFYMKRQYDGINFFDTTASGKYICVDYIPADGSTPTGEEDPPQPSTDFWTDVIQNDAANGIIYIEEIETPADAPEGEAWMSVKWNPHPRALAAEGNVRFAVSVVSTDIDKISYVWQTLPSTFTVQRGLGKRTGTPIAVASALEFADLQEQVAAIAEFFGNQIDDNEANDEEVIIQG